MVGKKRAHDRTVDSSPPYYTKPDDDEVKPSKPVYLVASLISWELAYSVFMVEAAAIADGDEPLHARTIDRFPRGNRAMPCYPFGGLMGLKGAPSSTILA
jgi:hypothetical protein